MDDGRWTIDDGRSTLPKKTSIPRLPEEAALEKSCHRRFRHVTRETTQTGNLVAGEFQAGHFEVFHLNSNEGISRCWNDQQAIVALPLARSQVGLLDASSRNASEIPR